EVAEDRERYFWRGQGRDGLAAVEAFAACAAEPAATEPDEAERLDDDLLMFDPGPSSSADAFTLSFSRQFSYVDAEGEHLYMDSLGLELWLPSTPDLTAIETEVIYGHAGSDAAAAWHLAVTRTPVYRHAIAGPIEHFLITFGQI